MKDKTSLLGYYTIGISALFLVSFLLLIFFGAQVYEDAVVSQDQNDQTRALRSYLITCTRSASAEDIVLKEGAAGIEGQILTIRDSGTDYGLQIYLHDGQLVENYAQLDAAPDPDTAQPIAPTDLFTVEQLSPETFAVTTDAGRTLLHTSTIAKAGQSAEESATDANVSAGDGTQGTAGAARTQQSAGAQAAADALRTQQGDGVQAAGAARTAASAAEGGEPR